MEDERDGRVETARDSAGVWSAVGRPTKREIDMLPRRLSFAARTVAPGVGSGAGAVGGGASTASADDVWDTGSGGKSSCASALSSLSSSSLVKSCGQQELEILFFLKCWFIAHLLQDIRTG